MVRLTSLLTCCLVVLAVAGGCGPMNTPMPIRLADDDQKKIDESWDKALAPVGRLEHQPLLDVLVATQAYQVGVDKLTFRSEKRVAAGTVVMEIDYDRLQPDQDRFRVTVYDHGQVQIRQESYGRKEIEETYKNLFVRYEELRQKAEAGELPPEEAKELEALKARHASIAALFPEKKEDGPDGKAKKPERGKPAS